MVVADVPSRPQSIQVASDQRSAVFVLAKRCIQACFGLLVLPRLAVYGLAKGLFGRRAFAFASESIARIPGTRGVYARQAFYRRTLSECGEDAYFGWLSVFSMSEARVGNRTYIGRFCSIGFADIGDEVMLADGVQILSGGHEHATGEHDGQSMQSQGRTFHLVRIGRGAWIGAGAIVMADVGAGTIVGAGAVVSRPLPDGCVAAGVPARVIKSIEQPEKQADRCVV